MSVESILFACHSKACAPPPAGTGGSSPSGGGSKSSGPKGVLSRAWSKLKGKKTGGPLTAEDHRVLDVTPSPRRDPGPKTHNPRAEAARALDNYYVRAAARRKETSNRLKESGLYTPAERASIVKNGYIMPEALDSAMQKRRDAAGIGQGSPKPKATPGYTPVQKRTGGYAFKTSAGRNLRNHYSSSDPSAHPAKTGPLTSDEHTLLDTTPNPRMAPGTYKRTPVKKASKVRVIARVNPQKRNTPVKQAA